MNSYTRTQEYEADMYGLNTSRQPDGFAQAAIHLGEYRKMNPGRSRSGSSSIIPAAAIASMPPCAGKPRT